MNIEPALFYCVSGFIIVYVCALGYVISMLQKDRDYYKAESKKYYDMWLEATDDGWSL